MDKEVKFSISKNFTVKSLSFMLILSVTATVLGFAVAYNEHRNLLALWDKYDEAMEKIESCEESISELSQQIEMQEIQHNQIVGTSTTEYHEDFYEEYNPSEYVADDNLPDAATVPSSEVYTGGYYVTKSGSKYHIGTCSFLSKSKIAIAMEQIKAEGYTPCSRCIK